MDACTSATDMWKRVECLMRGTIQNQVDRETHFTNEFDQFVAKPGEALVSVYNRFSQLMNDLERNNMYFLIVTINTKFLNSLQREWLKYVTQVRLAKRLTMDTGGGGGGSVDVVLVVAVKLEGTSADEVRALKKFVLCKVSTEI
ncbi:hypothetical protein Tco_0292097 [Tanacetum coccineum]